MISPKVLAVVITYNPDIAVLNRNISALVPQIDHILIYDNSSKNIGDIKKIKNDFTNVEVIANIRNEGLPINYNKALKYCVEKGYEWLLTMDQDTVVPDDLIEKYSRVFDIDDIAIISPIISDRKIQTDEVKEPLTTDTEWTEIDECISSAALNRVSTLAQLGGFDEKLFIDQVDFDYCKNVCLHGYKVVKINDCVVDHQIGDSEIKKIFGKEIIISNHSPMRKYYIFRNKIYYARKYHISIFKQPTFFITLLKQFLVLFAEKESYRKIILAIKGINDGIKL